MERRQAIATDRQARMLRRTGGKIKAASAQDALLVDLSAPSIEYSITEAEHETAGPLSGRCRRPRGRLQPYQLGLRLDNPQRRRRTSTPRPRACPSSPSAIATATPPASMPATTAAIASATGTTTRRSSSPAMAGGMRAISCVQEQLRLSSRQQHWLGDHRGLPHPRSNRRQLRRVRPQGERCSHFQR